MIAFLHHLYALAAAHPATVVALLYAAVSDLMPFLPTKANGVAQGLLMLLGKLNDYLNKKAAPVAALLFAGMLGFSGCATFKACELGKLPIEKQDALAAITAAALNPTAVGAATALEQLVVDVGKEQYSCAAQALITWGNRAGAKPWEKLVADRLAAQQQAHADAGTPFPACRA